jgi:hypothetical protein
LEENLYKKFRFTLCDYEPREENKSKVFEYSALAIGKRLKDIQQGRFEISEARSSRITRQSDYRKKRRHTL